MKHQTEPRKIFTLFVFDQKSPLNYFRFFGVAKLSKNEKFEFKPFSGILSKDTLQLKKISSFIYQQKAPRIFLDFSCCRNVD